MSRDFDPNAAALGDGVFGLPCTPDDSKVVLVPVPWEATVSYGAGTASAPAAILQASRQVDLFDTETGRPYERGIAMLDIPAEVQAWSDAARTAARPVIDAGGPGGETTLLDAVAEAERLSERMNGWVREETWRWLAQERLVGVVGGDHSTPFGAIQAIAEVHPGLGILHNDAHADLRKACPHQS